MATEATESRRANLRATVNPFRAALLVFCSLAASALCACGSSHQSFVQIRAADDFECIKEGIDVEEVARSRYRASGCGKQADYVCSATPDGVDCSQAPAL